MRILTRPQVLGNREEVIIMDDYISRQRIKDLMSYCLDIAKTSLEKETDLFKKTALHSYVSAIESSITVIESCQPADVQPINRWIDAQKNPPPIKNNLSSTSNLVLIVTTYGYYDVCFYIYDNEEGNCWSTADERKIYECEEVAYWQPFSRLSKEIENESN